MIGLDKETCSAVKLLFALLFVLWVLVLCSCTPAQIVGAIAGIPGAVECVRAPRNVERSARAALDREDADSALDELAKVSGWDVVRCAVEWILRSLTGARQDGGGGELGARSSEMVANRDNLQPQVDRARAWLARGKKQ